MTTWHWVRHGPTHETAFVGWRDVPADLSDTAQIARLTAFLPSDALVVSSDLIRAAATADAIGADRRRLPNDPDLREFHFGDWDGEHFSTVAERYPDLSRAYWETPGDTAPPGGESWNMAARRITAAVDRIARAHPVDHIIAVAHIGVILTQVQRAQQSAAAQTISQKIDNLSVSQVRFDGARWHADLINHCP